MRLEITTPPFGMLEVEYLRAGMSEQQYEILMIHALCIACLDGNAFEFAVEQYAPEAYANLWSNGVLDRAGLPDLYYSSATDAAFAGMLPNHPQYSQMDDARRKDILEHFVRNISLTNPNVEVVLERAAVVLGDLDRALDWIDQFSGTLNGIPREIAATGEEGKLSVLHHLAGISRHGHDA